MPILAGQIITAGQLDRMQPVPYSAVGSGTIAANQTDADVTGATVTFTTQTAGATYKAWAVWYFLASGGAPTGTALGRLNIDGVGQNPLATFDGDDTTERGTHPQNYHGTLASAGSHTFKLTATTTTNVNVSGNNCSIVVEITEVV